MHSSDFEEAVLQLFLCLEIILLKVKFSCVRQLFTKMKHFLFEYIQSKVVRLRLGARVTIIDLKEKASITQFSFIQILHYPKFVLKNFS